MKIKGFTHTGNGPKSGHSFVGGHGFTGSTGRTQIVRGYTRAVPTPASPQFKQKTAPQRGGHALTQRSQPVTQEDRVAGGKTPIVSGFAEGGPVRTGPGGPPNRAKPNPFAKAAYRDSPEIRERVAKTPTISEAAEGKPDKDYARGGMVGMAAPQAAAVGRAVAPASRGYGAFRRGPLIR